MMRECEVRASSSLRLLVSTLCIELALAVGLALDYEDEVGQVGCGDSLKECLPKGIGDPAIDRGLATLERDTCPAKVWPAAAAGDVNRNSNCAVPQLAGRRLDCDRDITVGRLADQHEWAQVERLRPL